MAVSAGDAGSLVARAADSAVAGGAASVGAASVVAVSASAVVVAGAAALGLGYAASASDSAAGGRVSGMYHVVSMPCALYELVLDYGRCMNLFMNFGVISTRMDCI